MTEAIQTIENIVSATDGKAVTDSLKVAQVFGKEHAKVLRNIRELNVPPDFNEANFGLVEYIDAKNEKRPMYNMTRNGFVVLVMGFTSKRAMQFKLAYIKAFDLMEARLNGTMNPEDYVQNQIETFGMDWVAEQLRQKEIQDAFYAPKYKLGDRNSKGYECSTIRRASNPVRGGRVPSARERAFITQPNLFTYSLLIKMNKKEIGE